MTRRPEGFARLVAAAVISGAVASTIVGTLFTGYVTRIEEEVRSQREWKERSVAELLGPMNIQFVRTKGSFDRWQQKNLYIETKIIKVGDEAIRDLLLEKGHLIPPELIEDAGKLIEHYDFWLELFEEQRGGKEPDLEATFTFAGPEGFPFSRAAGARFRTKFREYWQDLYGEGEGLLVGSRSERGDQSRGIRQVPTSRRKTDRRARQWKS